MRGPLPGVLAGILLAVAGGLFGGPPRAGDRPAPQTVPPERRAAGRAARKAIDFDAPDARWREGPVRYLITKDEDDAFRALKTDEERAEFIRTFWVSRDPDATTPENEYRDAFYARVTQANRVFTDSTKPGWKTDRGKIFILLGPPDEFDQMQDGNEVGTETVLWTYRNHPGGLGIDATPVIRFDRDGTGEYHLSNRVLLPGFETPLGIAFQTQAMQMKSLPQQKKVLDTIVTSRTLFDSGPFRTHRDFYRSGDGNTFTVLTLGTKTDLLTGGAPAGPGETSEAPGEKQGAPRERFDVVARLVGALPGMSSYDFAGTTSLRAGEGGPVRDTAGYLLFQGGMAVRPGPYTAYYGVSDHSVNQVYSFKESMEVPDFHEARFTLSSITLASRLERVDGTSAGYSRPFILGNLRVLPRPDDVFHNGEDFAFYYQIYGPATDPIDGRPDLDVLYQFYVANDTGPSGFVFAPLGKPIRLTRQRTQVQGYTFPLKDWPRATYRLRVQVTDNLSEQSSTEEVSFRVL